jgi:hypothetical protein
MSADFHYGAGIVIVHSMYSPIDGKGGKYTDAADPQCGCEGLRTTFADVL